MITRPSATAALRVLRAVGQNTRPWRPFSVTPCVVSSAATNNPEPLLQRSEPAKPFSEIPSKKGLPILGTLLDFTSKDVRYKMHKVTRKRFEELGMIFREKVSPSFPEMVVIGDPRDVETVFRSEGKWPHRPNIEIWEEARKELSIPLGLLLRWRLLRISYVTKLRPSLGACVVGTCCSEEDSKLASPKKLGNLLSPI